MNRKTFLTIAAAVATAVGVIALAAPSLVLAGKGVPVGPAVTVWVREVGILLVALGVTTFLLRGHPDSPTMRAFLLGNGLLQVGLFPIEIAAFAEGTITRLDGIAPSSILHLVLAAGFFHHARRIGRVRA